MVYNAVQPEGLPTVLLEAMAYAKPVIASAIGGALEIVQDGCTGILTPPNNVTALADAMDTLLSSPGDQETMGQAGLKRLTESFTVSQQVQKTTKIYLAILQGVQP
jgi:glycosyltransferase involved in cell wall biosynthesis